MKCAGCQACRTGLLPEFATDDEELDFWEVHSPEQFPPAKTTVVRRGRPIMALKKQKISFMIHPILKARLEELAAEAGVGYQTLMHLYLTDRVEHDTNMRAMKPVLQSMASAESTKVEVRARKRQVGRRSAVHGKSGAAS